MKKSPKEGITGTSIEALLSQSLEHFPARIYLKDIARKFIYVNQALLDAAKCRGKDEILGKRDEDLFIGNHLSAVRMDEERIIHEGACANIIERLELETWSDDRSNWVWTTKIAVVGEGRTIAIFGVTRNADTLRVEDAAQRLIGGAMPVPAKHLGVYHEPPGDKAYGEPPWYDAAFRENFPGDSVLARFRLIHHSDLRPVLEFLRRARDSDETFNDLIDFRARIRNQSEYHWVSGHAIGVGKGKHRTLVVTHRDVTEQRVRETIAARVLDAFPGYVFVKDSEGRFRFMNTRLLALLKRDLAQVRNQTDKELGFSEAESKAFRDGDRQALEAAQGQPILVDSEPLSIPGSGEIKRLVTIKVAIPAIILDPWTEERNRNARHVLGFSWDITNFWQEIENANLVWKTLLTSSDDAIYVKDTEQRYREVNQAFAYLVGKPIPAILGKVAAELFLNDKRLVETIETEDKVLLKTGKVLPQKVRSFASNNRIRVGLSSKLPIKDDRNRVTGILGINRDITGLQPLFALGDNSSSAEFPTLRTKELAVVSWRLHKCDEFSARFTGEPLHNFFEALFDLVGKNVTRVPCRLAQISADRGSVVFGAFDEVTRLPGRCIQALRFALSLARAFDAMGRRWDKRWQGDSPYSHGTQLGIGVHAGTTNVGFLRMGSIGQFCALGETMDVAMSFAENAVALDGTPRVLGSSVIKAKCSEGFKFRKEPKRISKVLLGYALVDRGNSPNKKPKLKHL